MNERLRHKPCTHALIAGYSDDLQRDFSRKSIAHSIPLDRNTCVAGLNHAAGALLATDLKRSLLLLASALFFRTFRMPVSPFLFCPNLSGCERRMRPKRPFPSVEIEAGKNTPQRAMATFRQSFLSAQPRHSLRKRFFGESGAAKEKGSFGVSLFLASRVFLRGKTRGRERRVS